MHVGYRSVLRVAESTLLHKTYQCTAQEFDRSGSIMSILDVCIHIATHTHCEQQHVNAL